MDDNAELTFWGHLDVLRGSIIRIIIVATVFAMAAFCMKDSLFSIVLAPSHSDFITYRLLGSEPFHIRLINVGLTEQFAVHIKTALAVGLFAASPYIIFILYRFVAPALYDRERHYAVRIVGSGYLMFVIGTLVDYFLIFPLTVRFLGTYQVSAEVESMLSLSSYIDTLLTMSVVFGAVFEIPVISWLLAKAGILKPELMTAYRRQAIVAILVVAAVITPTGDAFTLMVVALPIWLLYEMSIIVVRLSAKTN